MGDRDEPKTADAIVDHARLIAQAQGKVLLPEMVAALDEEIAARCDSARAAVKTYGDDCWGWEEWGRRTHVLESLLSFLQRIDNDPEARNYLVKRFKREVIRGEVRVDKRGDSPAA